MASSKPEPERRYLEELAERAGAILGDRLVGVYAGGSFALGGYEPGRSDLDVAVVVDSGLEAEARALLVECLRHESLPCPARKLELVIYRLRTVRSGSASRDFELNLNSGEGDPLQIDIGPAGGRAEPPTFWFPIDRSILAQAGVAIAGPRADRVFAPIPPAELRPALEESREWHRLNDRGDSAANAARAARFLADGHWISKLEAATAG